MAPIPPRPLVSVLMANFNYARFIGDAIDSVLGQSYSRLELVVCDDGSTDDSVEVIHQYTRQDSRVTLVTKPNGGHASAVDAAFASSTGQIICLLDADDWWAPGKVQAVLDIWRKSPDVGMVGHPLVRVSKDGAKIGQVPEVGRLERGWIAHGVQSRGGRWSCPVTSSISVHRSLAELMFPIPTRGVDTFMGTSAALLSVVGAVDTPLGFYRMHGSNMYGYLHWQPGQLGQIDLRGDMREMQDWFDATNKWLVQIGHPERVLEPSKNLYLYETRLMTEMLTSGVARGRLLRSWAGLTLMLATQPQCDLLHRIFIPPAMATALALPLSSRTRFLAAFVGRAQWKFTIRRILDRLNRLWQRSSDSPS